MVHVPSPVGTYWYDSDRGTAVICVLISFIALHRSYLFGQSDHGQLVVVIILCFCSSLSKRGVKGFGQPDHKEQPIELDVVNSAVGTVFDLQRRVFWPIRSCDCVTDKGPRDPLLVVVNSAKVLANQITRSASVRCLLKARVVRAWSKVVRESMSNPSRTV
jgi:hypothetical protein